MIKTLLPLFLSLLLTVIPTTSGSIQDYKDVKVEVEYDEPSKLYRVFVTNGSRKSIVNGKILVRYSVYTFNRFFHHDDETIEFNQIKSKERKEIYTKKKIVGKMTFNYESYEVLYLKYRGR